MMLLTVAVVAWAEVYDGPMIRHHGWHTWSYYYYCCREVP